jgi:predicted GNAT superfamily acetyltransferase
LKWGQREKSLELGVKFIKWTFQPVLARNAFFNLEKLGAVIPHYEPNFYGTDYPEGGKTLGLDSDRLFAEWHLETKKVIALSKAEKYVEPGEVRQAIEIPKNWNELVKTDLKEAIDQQQRIKGEFEKAFDEGLVARGFDRENARYLLY